MCNNNYLNITIKEIIDLELSNHLLVDKKENLCQKIISILYNTHRKLERVGLDVEDFTSHIWMGIKESLAKYDPMKKVPLINYIAYVTKKRILDYAKKYFTQGRKGTLQAINSNRGVLVGNNKTVLERDIDDYSYEQYIENKKNSKYIFLLNDVMEKEDELIFKTYKLILKGHSLKDIQEKFKISKSTINKCRQIIKNHLISFGYLAN